MKQTKVEHWIENLKAHPSEIFTKKELSQITGLSNNTVYETLKAAGLDTKATSYTLSELLERFVPARLMLDEGRTYEEVSNHFKVEKIEQQETEQGVSLQDAVGALQVGIYEDAKRNRERTGTVHASSNRTWLSLPLRLKGVNSGDESGSNSVY
jgi:hypothetical protein